MCGRFVITSTPNDLRTRFGYTETPNFPARYNIAPTQPVPVVAAEGEGRHFRLMRWGLIPSWVKDPKAFALLINARSETVCEKPAFRAAMKHRRCLIPADGFYEWQAGASGKQPYFIHPANGGPIAFAGIWETWSGPNGEELDTVALITTPASADLAILHDRMPAVIMPEAFALWLNVRAVDARTASALLVPAPRGFFVWHPVSTAVNRAGPDMPTLIDAVAVG